MAITDTGMRGFLQWARQQYPPAIYQQIAQGIQQSVPQAFSGYMAGGWRSIARRQGFSDGSSATVDTADAADSTASNPSWADMISQIIGTATGAYLNINQQQTQQAIVNQQLQAAANGKAPLPISLSSSGITFGSSGITAGSGLLLAVLAFLAYKALK